MLTRERVIGIAQNALELVMGGLEQKFDQTTFLRAVWRQLGGGGRGFNFHTDRPAAGRVAVSVCPGGIVFFSCGGGTSCHVD